MRAKQYQIAFIEHTIYENLTGAFLDFLDCFFDLPADGGCGAARGLLSASCCAIALAAAASLAATAALRAAFNGERARAIHHYLKHKSSSGRHVYSSADVQTDPLQTSWGATIGYARYITPAMMTAARTNKLHHNLLAIRHSGRSRVEVVPAEPDCVM